MQEDIEKDMSPKLIQDLGRLYPTENSKQKQRFGLYKCGYCGKEFKGNTNKVKRGELKSCGCILNRDKITHKLSKHRLFKTWQGMLHRCSSGLNPSFVNYGGRGIKVCEEWLDIRNFIKWADSTYVEGYTLDRIDNDGNYEPNNCTWSDKTIQSIKQRKSKRNTSGFVGITWDKSINKWKARIRLYNKTKYLGDFLNIEEAVQARDNYIIQNNLPHKLSTEY